MRNMEFNESFSLDFSTELRIDAMYYLSAQQSFKIAELCVGKIQKAEEHLSHLKERLDQIKEKYQDDPAKEYDELEPISIQMEDAEFSIGAEHGCQIQQIASIHIFCSASLEAFINSRGKDLLNGKYRDTFESMSLEGKWLFLPKLNGLNGFDPGINPFQDFSKMVKYRNQLVHYKSKKEKWKSPGIPEFLVKLGLTLDCAKNSLLAVGNMIDNYCGQTNEESPYWLRRDFAKLPKDIISNFFEIQIVNE